jgi:PPOX class probable F420-dependent enzyme
MTLSEEECWARLAGARHGVLATVHALRGVDAVPVVFAVTSPGRIVIPVDAVKAKRSARLQRLVNIERDPRCVLLVDEYRDDWSQLWWVRVHARAQWSAAASGELRAALAERYPQYRPSGTVLGVLTLEAPSVSGWRAGWRAGSPAG